MNQPKNPKTLSEIQAEVAEWSERNFGPQPSWRQVLGMQEELGELSHAYLKRSQGIRVNEDHAEAIKDAVGDILIYLCDFCAKEGLDSGTILNDTWDQVKQRNWKANAATGT